MTIDEEYKGCRNCKYQPEPLQTCDWIKHQKEVYRVCPMWEIKESGVKMTIDEAIAKLRSNAIMDKYNMCGYSMEQHEQIAEWLEELKDLREMKETIECNSEVLEQQGYNKAIDDFAKSIIDMVNDFPTVENENGEIRPMRIEEMCKNISKQLKAGDK